MKRNLWVILRRNRFLLIMGVCILTVTGFVLVDQEMKLQELNYEAGQLLKVVEEKSQVVEELNKQVESLDTDAAKEALARQKLNMIKRDEILYIVEPAEGNN